MGDGQVAADRGRERKAAAVKAATTDAETHLVLRATALRYGRIAGNGIHIEKHNVRVAVALGYRQVVADRGRPVKGKLPEKLAKHTAEFTWSLVPSP